MDRRASCCIECGLDSGSKFVDPLEGNVLRWKRRTKWCVCNVGWIVYLKYWYKGCIYTDISMTINLKCGIDSRKRTSYLDLIYFSFFKLLPFVRNWFSIAIIRNKLKSSQISIVSHSFVIGVKFPPRVSSVPSPFERGNRAIRGRQSGDEENYTRRGTGGILRRRMSIKRCGRLTITKTSTKARTRAPFRTPVGSSRDNLYGNSRDVISPPWQTLAGGATTHEPTYPAHVLPRWPRTFHRERERGCHVHIITKSGHRFIEPRTSDARSLVCPSILLSCKRVHAPLCAITTSDLCRIRVCACACARESVYRRAAIVEFSHHDSMCWI